MNVSRIACWLGLLLWPFPLLAEPGVLTLAYPEREKEPLIAEAPDNRGLYQELFSAAARKIGMRLKIVRLPKKRLLYEMGEHQVDLYPGSFAESRIGVMRWLDSGLMIREVCLTRPGVPPLNGLSQAPPMRVIYEIGNSKAEINLLYPQLTPAELGPRIDIPQAVRLLKGERGDLFIIEEVTLRHFLKKNRLASVERLGVRLHENCLGEVHPVWLGVSRLSPHYAEVPNPRYNPNAPRSVYNLPTLIAPDSTAGRLGAALQQMKASGETARLLEKYTK